MKRKIVVIFDADWLTRSIASLKKEHISYKKYRDLLKDRGEIEDILYFTGWDPDNEGQMRFFQHLIGLGYTVYYKEIERGELARNEDRYQIFYAEIKSILGKYGILDPNENSYNEDFYRDIERLVEKMKIESNLDPMICYRLGRIPYDYESKTVILVSGDGDFAKPLAGLRETGYRIIVMGFKENTSFKLRNVSHEFVNLNDILPIIRKGETGSSETEEKLSQSGSGLLGT